MPDRRSVEVFSMFWDCKLPACDGCEVHQDELEPRRAGHPPARTSEAAQPVAAPAPAVPRHFRETVNPRAIHPDFALPGKLPSETFGPVPVPMPVVLIESAPKPIGLAGDSATRKESPIYEGFVCYFPNAMAEVARLSKYGNDKHNPGTELHWSFNKSNDHGDCIMRHQTQAEQVDDSCGFLHAVMVAWRAMAQLEKILLETHPELVPGKNVKGFER